MQRRTWIGIGILVAVVLLIALIVGLVVGLRKHKKKESSDSGPSLDEILSNDSTFPNGSYQVSAESLKVGPEDLNPMLVTLKDLKLLGLTVDNSSLVAETNRLSVLFVRIPRNGTARINLGGIGIRFGSSDTLNVIPLNLSSITNSGLRYIGALNSIKSSDVYQVQVRMAEQMCADSASGSCSIVNWSPYFVFGDNLGSAANFSNELPVACGSQCDANSTSRCATSCSTCDGQQVAGANTPVTRRYRMNTTSARNLLFSYETYEVPDRVTVTYGGVNLFDSTCIGTEGERLTPITYEGRYTEVRVDVEPNCDGTTSTQWYFTLPCAGGCQGCDEYSCLDDQKAHCGSDGYLKRYGWYFCESYYDSYQNFDLVGKSFINCVRPKLLSYVESYLKGVKGDVNCTDLSNKAFASHTAIYQQCGFCNALSTNKIAFGEVLVAWRNIVSADAWSQLGTMFCKCAYCIPGVCSNC